MLRPKRRNRLGTFHARDNIATIVFLIALFGSGFLISLKSGIGAAAGYIACWGLSYLVLFAGTCRHCIYFGQKCPIPLEGSCVGIFFKKGKEDFGYAALIWATAAYLLRVLIPVYVILNDRLLGFGLLYVLILSMFWMSHLRFTGCPNCVNYQCPLNPEQEKQYE